MKLAPRLLALLFLALAVPAAAGEVDVRLTSGSRLRGEILSEDDREIELRLEDGMRMRIRRTMIAGIEPVRPAPEPGPSPAAEPPALPARPEAAEGTAAAGDPGAAADRPRAGDPGFFETAPEVDWAARATRVPTLTVARLTRFRAYEYVEHAPLALSGVDERFRELVLEHGHGGSLALYRFRYAGRQELRYGDELRFVAELTGPDDGERSLFRLDEGPIPVTDRLAVFLVRREGRVSRLATTTVFDNGTFRQASLDALADEPMDVRTYTAAYAPVARTRLTPGESAFLESIRSPFGDSLRVRLLRERFRLEWLGAPPEERPALDPDLVEQNVVRPLAHPGGPVADPAKVVAAWGDAGASRRRLSALVGEIRERLAGIGVEPGGEYYVESDRVGVAGKLGVTIETRRHRIDRALLEELTRE